MAQVAAEIIQEYQHHMNGDKLSDMLTHDGTAIQLPPGIVLEGVDHRHLALPFGPQAILPTMRLVFSAMQNQVRFALSDKQINDIGTGPPATKTFVTIGFDFIRHLLNPPKPVNHPDPPKFLYSKLTQIKFPLNVEILPDKQYEKRKSDEISAIKSRRARVEQQKRDAELSESIRKSRFERMVILSKERRKARKTIREKELASLDEQAKKDENYSQFYGRIA